MGGIKMYLRSTNVMLKPNSRQTAEKIGEYFNEIFKKQKGLKTVYFGTNDEIGASIVITVWETKEDADEATQKIFPLLQKEFGEYIKGAATQVYEIVEL
jgi:hypothetical protein